jgi:DNA-binding NarL/FixJ family response regulator
MAVPLAVSLRTVEQIFGLTATVACERYAWLSPREMQVARLLATGKPSHEIAAELGIGMGTMDSHRTHIRNKLAANTLVQVANVVNLARLAAAAK